MPFIAGTQPEPQQQQQPKKDLYGTPGAGVSKLPQQQPQPAYGAQPQRRGGQQAYGAQRPQYGRGYGQPQPYQPQQQQYGQGPTQGVMGPVTPQPDAYGAQPPQSNPSLDYARKTMASLGYSGGINSPTISGPLPGEMGNPAYGAQPPPLNPAVMQGLQPRAPAVMGDEQQQPQPDVMPTDYPGRRYGQGLPPLMPSYGMGGWGRGGRGGY